MSTIHKGMINGKLKRFVKDSGLNNYDLATTKLYKGVVPMWKQLGFSNDSFDVPFRNYLLEKSYHLILIILIYLMLAQKKFLQMMK